MLEPLRILFILKRREATEVFSPYSYSSSSTSGLANSVRFIVEMLTAAHIEAKCVQVIDNNNIDGEVHRYKPTHVVIEALWVVPDKFRILKKLHPTVEWIVRLHSEVPFLANEGIALEWIKAYVGHDHVSIAPNSPEAVHDLRAIVRSAYPVWHEDTIAKKVVYLPNFYPVQHEFAWKFQRHTGGGPLDAGCFGAIRPLKNNLIQAAAAISYAESKGLKLRFHVNSNRNEQGGDNALKNLRALFNGTSHRLIEHPWMDHDDFLELLRSMDLSMCVSFTETFCIVAADSVSLGVPTVVSKEIEWASPLAKADTTDSRSIVKAIDRVLNPWKASVICWHNRHGLINNAEAARTTWLYFVEREMEREQQS